LVEYAFAEVNNGGSLGGVLADVIPADLRGVGRWVLHFVSLAADPVKRPKHLAHGWLELRTGRFVHGQVAAASGGAQPLVLQHGGQRLASCVIDERVSARRVVLADLVRGYEMLAGLEDEAVGVLAGTWISKVTLRPVVSFSGKAPSDEEHRVLHHKAHEKCYIANSVKSEVVVRGAMSFA